MVDSRIKLPISRLIWEEKCTMSITYTNLVHNGDPGVLYLLFKLEHGWGDITCGDNVLLISNRGLDYGNVKSVRD